MKIINTKTGEILEDVKYIDTSLTTIEIHYLDNGVLRLKTEKDYHTFLQNWKDYEQPKEPLIKDKKIRKAVRAFAKLNNSATIIFELSYGKSSIIARADNGFAMLWVAGESWETNGKGIKWDEPYTIAELCGEEEEWVTD